MTLRLAPVSKIARPDAFIDRLADWLVRHSASLMGIFGLMVGTAVFLFKATSAACGSPFDPFSLTPILPIPIL
jgi:multidrug efflux pump subunit AcrB